MGKKVAILQSNYIPWKGYFDIINQVDLFIFHDDLQYTKLDWRNRNRIKTPQGLKWLSIPCGTDEHRLINEVELRDSSWQRKHWNIIEANYSKAPFFKQYAPVIKDFYWGQTWRRLSELNQTFIKFISHHILGITTEFDNSENYALTHKKAERVIELLKKVNATSYLSGPAAKAYLSEEVFRSENIQLEWMDYSGYPEYPQLYPPFAHEVSIIDLIFNTGPDATKYMKSFSHS
ncbi:MAG: hypothetical protein D6675_13865 [Gemmatimonadetes bacterium]|nr:MAG: hypothetical protein D6675_13865 [Gemmatimonadota bacterium]